VAAGHLAGGPGSAVPARLLSAVIRRVLRHVVRLAAVTLAVAAAGVVVPSAAQAATCSTASGVSVVVDFHQLGGGVQTFCDAGGAGKYAGQQFADAGHPLTYVQNEAFVCRVDGMPASDPCAHTPPSDAYWSLWWSDGKSGRWSYSSSGVTSLKVPAGGYVGLSWQHGNAQAEPGAPATAHGSQATSSPTTRPPSSPHPSTGPGDAPTSSAAPGAPAPSGTTSSPSTGPSGGQDARQGKGTRHDKHTKHPKADDQRSDGSDNAQAFCPAANVSDGPGGSGGSDSGGLPGWVAPVAIAVLFVGVGTIALVRRKSSGGG